MNGTSSDKLKPVREGAAYEYFLVSLGRGCASAVAWMPITIYIALGWP
jgi:hypothetical protein